MAICFSIVFRRLCLFCVFGVLFCFGGPRRSCLGSGGGSLQRNPALVWTRSTLSVHRNRKQGKGCFFWMLGFRDFWAPGAPVARRWRCCKAWPYGFLLFVSTVAFLVFSVFVSASEGPGGALWEQPGPHLARKWGFCKAWPYVFLLCFMCFCLTRFRFFFASEVLGGALWDQGGGEEEPRAAGADDCVPCLSSYCEAHMFPARVSHFWRFRHSIFCLTPTRSPNPRGKSTIYRTRAVFFLISLQNTCFEQGVPR